MSGDAPTVRFEPMRLEDASFVLGIRNDLSTRSMLHDSQEFTQEAFTTWFEANRPQWLVIRDSEQNVPVGYVRTKWMDAEQTELQVGVDIDPLRRRQGYARAAYTELFERLRRKMVGVVSLEVLDHNRAALPIYQELGFEITDRYAHDNGCGSTNSICMRRDLQPLSGRQCKVVASWFGHRRHLWAGRHGPQIAYEMYCYLLNREYEVDQGVPTDTIFVINMPIFGDVGSDPWFRRVYDLVTSQDGNRTPSGRIRVLERPNLGISFGAYDHAFHKLESEYDFWHFLEDDHIILKSGCLAADCSQFKELDRDTGFIASLGCSQVIAPHCHGGCGVSSREVLKDTKRRNHSSELGRHHLPFWLVHQEGADGHEPNGEVRFTAEIAAQGLELVDSRNEKFLVNWFGSELRNCHGEAARLVEWMPEMAMESAPVGPRFQGVAASG